jgi:hypothetical protein
LGSKQVHGARTSSGGEVEACFCGLAAMFQVVRRIPEGHDSLYGLAVSSYGLAASSRAGAERHAILRPTPTLFDVAEAFQDRGPNSQTCRADLQASIEGR